VYKLGEAADKNDSWASPDAHYRQLLSQKRRVLFIDADAGKIIDINQYL
jgi:hypothetical protein